MAIGKKDTSLKIAGTAFRMLALGGRFTPEELRNFGDLCMLAIPMKYRFDKKEIAEIDAQARLRSIKS